MSGTPMSTQHGVPGGQAVSRVVMAPPSGATDPVTLANSVGHPGHATQVRGFRRSEGSVTLAADIRRSAPADGALSGRKRGLAVRLGAYADLGSHYLAPERPVIQQRADRRGAP